MTAIFLIFFSLLFYQLLIKPAFSPTTIPNANSNYSRADQNEQFIRMWRNLQQFPGEKKEEKQKAQTKKAQKETRSNPRPKGFQGGEYIEYEEL